MKKKFLPAFHGLGYAVKDKSIRIQLILAILALAAGLVLGLDHSEWIAVILCIGVVVTTEILNTCIEKVCDLYSMEYNEKIKEIKDLAAAAVLCASIMALLTALVILIRHIGG